MFSVLEEYSTFFKERHEFFRSELVHLDLMQKTGDDYFLRHLSRRYKFISDIIRKAQELRENLRLDSEINLQDIKTISDIEQLYFIIPGMLGQTLQAFLNRRGRDYVSKYAPKKLSGAVLSLSSIHPAYPASILGLECLSNTIHNEFTPFYGDQFSHPSPSIVIWGFFEYSTISTKFFDSVLKILEKSGYNNIYGDFLFSSSIHLPRWSTHQIRIAGCILAHEHFHHVMYLVKKFNNERLVRNYSSAEFKKRCGSNIAEIIGVYIALYENLEDFLKTNRCETSCTSYNVVEELLCDIVGAIMVGPGFSYALSLHLLPSILKDLQEGKKTHPAVYARLELQKFLLNNMKYPRALQRFKDFIKPIAEFISSTEYKERSTKFARVMADWIKSSDTQSYLKDFVEFFGLTVNSYSREVGKKEFKSYYLGNEILWESKIMDLIKMAEQNNIEIEDYDYIYTPTDILNAYWLAKEKEYKISGEKSTAHYLQMSWRILLSDFQKRLFGRKGGYGEI